ncbi:MAG: carbohydrate-binding protein [Rikenellaceae bacterium]
MGADSVTGHFKDLLGKYLVSPMHDPTIFYEDNAEQTPYMIYGSKDHQYHIVRLGEDMISVDEKPRPIIINGAEWEQEPGWLDKNYFFKQGDTYYLSWGSGYATSKNIYGPYECQGYFGEGHHLGNLAHSSFFWWKGQFYHIWCYYIRKGYRYRSTIISYCHVGDDGKISTDTKFLDAHFSHGVARYDSSWDMVEAEWYYEISDNSHKRGAISEGFYALLNGKNSFVRFSNFNFEKVTKTMTINLSSSRDTEIEVREGGLDGQLLGSLKVKGNDKRECVNFDVDIDKGSHDLYIINKGDSTLNIDWFKFN